MVASFVSDAATLTADTVADVLVATGFEVTIGTDGTAAVMFTVLGDTPVSVPGDSTGEVGKYLPANAGGPVTDVIALPGRKPAELAIKAISTGTPSVWATVEG